MESSRSLAVLVLVATVMRLGWAAATEAGHDEAYHVLYVASPDWSYYDHPPMVGLMAAFGGLLDGPGRTIFAHRVPFVLLFAGSTLLIARLTRRDYGPRAGFLAALAFSVAGYLPLGAGTFVLPDGPMLFFWLLTIDRFRVALARPDGRPGSAWTWVLVGLAWAGALLSKYHGVLLLPGLGLFLVLERRARPWLRSPGPWLAVAVGLIGFAPVLGWNAARGWASFGFQAGRGLPAPGWPRPDGLALAMLASAAYLLPWIGIPLLISLGRAWADARRGATTTSDRFWLVQSLVPLSFFGLISLWRPLLPHWMLVGLVGAIPLAASRWEVRWAVTTATRRRGLVSLLAGVPLALAVLVVAQARYGILPIVQATGIGRRGTSADPTLEMVGWSTIADELKRRGLLDDPQSFLFTSKWFQSGQLGFAMSTDTATPQVLCYNAGKAQGFQYWSQPERWVGRDGILVVVDPNSTEPAAYAPWFERIEPLGGFQIERGGTAVRQVRLYRCVAQVKPFPFTDAHQAPVARGEAAPPVRWADASHPSASRRR